MDELFEAAGELAAAYADVDWAGGPLGDPSTWSPTLRSTVEVALRTEFPVTLLWGPDLVLVYNQAYVTLIGDKHPAALGMPAHEVFDEAWDQIGPWLRAARDEGRTTYVEDTLIPLERHGFLEDCYFTFSYSRVMAPDRADHGVIDIATETTTSVVTQRRLGLLGRLAELLAGVDEPRDVAPAALLVLRGAVDDLVEVDLVPPGTQAETARREMAVEETPDGARVWLALRSTSDERLVGVDDPRPLLVVRPSPRLALDDDHLVFLRLVADTVSQAIDRVEALASERRVAAAERAMSETLQRSLLTAAQVAPGCRVAVRYQPAADHAQIGGDWHDSFLLPDGRLAVAIGDVAGHDRQAAAAMAQVRNLLRGIAYTTGGHPAAALAALDRALEGLEVGSFATGVLAALDAPPPGRAGGARTLTWSNAGHPSPVLLAPDGTARLLDSDPELLLGVRSGAVRTDHVVTLEPGSTLLLFTDGLVERRGHRIDDGLQQVVAAMEGGAGLDPEAMCDHVLERLDAAREDDIALVCLRVD